MSTHDDSDAVAFRPLSEDSGLCGGPGQLSCGEANEMIQLYLDEVTDLDEGARVAEHLHDCSPCESELVVYRRIVASLERCRPDVPADTAARLRKFCSELHSAADSTAPD